MPRSVTKHKSNGVKTSMEHQKWWIRLRRISSPLIPGDKASVRRWYFLKKLNFIFEILNYYPGAWALNSPVIHPLIPGASMVYSSGVTMNRGQPSPDGPGRSYLWRIGGLLAGSIETISGAHMQIHQGHSAAGLKFVTPGEHNMDSPAIRGLVINKSLLVQWK
jgi:hypothetical protein